MRVWWLLVALGAAAGCAGSAAARRADVAAADERPRTVRRVEVVGNRAFDDDAIVAGLATRPPRGFLFFRRRETFDPLALRLDLKRIETFYKERGYFAARVTDVDVVPVGEDGVTVRIHVDEGEPTRIASVTLAGAPPDAALEPGIRTGDVFDHPAYLLAKDRLQAALYAAGHAHASVDGLVEVDRDHRVARVTFQLQPGPVARLGRPRIHGLERVPESAVLARVAWEDGDRFDPTKLELTEGRLYGLGFFSSVRIDWERDPRLGVVRPEIHLTEGSRRELRLGGGVAADRVRWEIRARAACVVRGFVDPLLTLRLDARPAYVFLRGREGENGFGGEAALLAERQDFLAPRLLLAVEAAYAAQEAEAYSTRGPRGRISLSRTLLDDRLLLGASWSLYDLDFPRIDDAIDRPLREELGLVQPYRLGFYEEYAAWDGRDRPLTPRRGWYGEFRLEEGGPWAGGVFRYVKLTPEARGYVPVGPRVVLAGRARVGFFAGGETLPITQRYFGGGASSHRGFGFRQLSPVAHDLDGRAVVIGGEALVETSVEARLDVVRWRGSWLGLAVFLDGGDVTRTADDLRPGRLHWAAGLGLRYETAVGPLRLDVGVRLNRTGPGEPEAGERVAIHLSLGEAF